MTFGELEQPYMEGAVVEFDDQYIANDITITQAGAGGLVARRTNATSVSRYFTRSLAKTVAYLTASDVSALADYLLARLQAPSLRVPTLTLDMAANPALFANLVRGIGDRVTFTRRPIGSPATSFVNVIEGIAYSVKPDAFTATYLLSPP